MRIALQFQFFWFLSSLPMLMGVQTSTEIILNPTLTAGNVLESPWVSISGDFAFGFKPVDGGFLVAIWYNKISDKTVTWSANRGEIAQQGSALRLSNDGLALTNSNGTLTWSTTLTGGVCGVNSTCNLGTDQRTNCHCVSNYMLINEVDKLGGCKLAFPDYPSKHKQKPSIESVSIGISVFLIITVFTLAVFICRRKTIIKIIRSQEYQNIAGTNLKSFSYGELQEATTGFTQVIGQGGSAIVYKGTIDSEEGKVIAVKKLKESINENQREFESEVKAIAITGHRNLVQLIGFCNEEQHWLLVYEYMPNGSIADALFGGQRVNWSKRIRFALDIARGLNYLHDECSIQIIHCDIKPQNVLLDDSFTARISDFGLAKLLKKDQTHTRTEIRGTKGYVAPEWFRSMPITAKVDVFSYGILLLEIICCRRCFVAEMEDESQMVLADWAYDCYKEERVDKLVEKDDEAVTDIEKVKKLVMVALWCIQEDPSHRPSMNKVVDLIKEAFQDPSSPDLIQHISSP